MASEKCRWGNSCTPVFGFLQPTPSLCLGQTGPPSLKMKPDREKCKRHQCKDKLCMLLTYSPSLSFSLPPSLAPFPLFPFSAQTVRSGVSGSSDQYPASCGLGFLRKMWPFLSSWILDDSRVPVAPSDAKGTTKAEHVCRSEVQLGGCSPWTRAGETARSLSWAFRPSVSCTS